jgi:hypothetical protein
MFEDGMRQCSFGAEDDVCVPVDAAGLPIKEVQGIRRWGCYLVRNMKDGIPQEAQTFSFSSLL